MDDITQIIFSVQEETGKQKNNRGDYITFAVDWDNHFCYGTHIVLLISL